MTDQLSPIERDIVLEAVQQFSSPWIIQAKGSASRIFIPQGKATIHAGKILFVPAAAMPQEVFSPILGIDAAVFFFYGGRGMFFSSRAQKTAQGTAFIISPAIYKQDDDASSRNSRISAKLYYDGITNAASVINAESSADYPLFNPCTWLHFTRDQITSCHNLLFDVADLEPVSFPEHSPAQEALEISKRILYLPEHKLPEKNFFPFEAGITQDDVFSSELSLLYAHAADHDSECFIPFAQSADHNIHSVCALRSDSPVLSPFEILRTTMLLPGVRYLAETDDTIHGTLNRQYPLTILYITESKIVLGSRQQDNLLQYGTELPIVFSADCGPIQREITGTVKISQRYDNGPRYIVVGNLLNLKEEDKRFLYEKLYPTPYK